MFAMSTAGEGTSATIKLYTKMKGMDVLFTAFRPFHVKPSASYQSHLLYPDLVKKRVIIYPNPKSVLVFNGKMPYKALPSVQSRAK